MPEEIVPQAEGLTDVKFDAMRLPDRLSQFSRLVMRDLNATGNNNPTFFKYTKDEIAQYLKDPFSHEKNLRDAVIYMYSASSHFRRLIQYFSSLSDLTYVISPCRIDTATAKEATVKRNYKRVLNLMTNMDVKNQFEKILTVCLREDVFYGTIWENSDSIIIQQLPSDYCTISVVEDNVLNVSFNFSYFDTNRDNLQLYPAEFTTKYNLYLKNRVAYKWQELDAPNSFAIKANKDILSYAVPPFVGILRELYDLEDYRTLKMTKEELQNYAMLVMTLPMNSDGEFQIPYTQAVDFYSNLDKVLPEEIGSVLSPMEINKISFEKDHAGDVDTIAQAENNMFTAAGVSSLLFNNVKATSSALMLSIKVDQAMTYSIVKSIEQMVNRFIRRHSFGKYFKATFLDVSPFNRKEAADQYLKACQYGMPMVSYFCATQGLLQDEMDAMNFLEDNVLGVKERFKPLQSSNTMSSNPDSDGEAGRPESDITELTDEGEAGREKR